MDEWDIEDNIQKEEDNRKTVRKIKEYKMQDLEKGNPWAGDIGKGL